MTIGDQVKNLEQEYDAAVALADSLATQCDALKSANAVLEKQLVLRTAALADTEAHMAEALEMVDAVANAALSMLKVAKRPMGTPSAIATARVIADAAPLVPVLVTDDMLAAKPPASSFAGSLTGVIDPAAKLTGAAVKGVIVRDWPSHDTAGFKDDEPLIFDVGLGVMRAPTAAEAQPFASQVAGDIMAADNAVQSDTIDEIAAEEGITELTAEERATIARIAEQHAAPNQRPLVDTTPIKDAMEKLAAPITEPEPSAVDRMRRGNSADLLPAPTLMPGPVLVTHNDSGLPIFLQRDTVFQRQGDAIFS